MDQFRWQAFANTFVTYLIRELQEKIKSIDHIILYGSVAKREATEHSDVDIAIDTKEKHLKKRINILLHKFTDSREAVLFKTEGIAPPLSVKVGPLSQWPELEHSIQTSGIVLWGPYTALMPEGKPHLIYSWSQIKKNRGAFLNAIYGFTVKRKRYPGLLIKTGGQRLGKSAIIVPLHQQDKYIPLFKKYKVNVRQKEITLHE